MRRIGASGTKIQASGKQDEAKRSDGETNASEWLFRVMNEEVSVRHGSGAKELDQEDESDPSEQEDERNFRHSLEVGLNT